VLPHKLVQLNSFLASSTVHLTYDEMAYFCLGTHGKKANVVLLVPLNRNTWILSGFVLYKYSGSTPAGN